LSNVAPASLELQLISLLTIKFFIIENQTTALIYKRE
jgi:hypothetical protein